jgi:hypothetical protein
MGWYQAQNREHWRAIVYTVMSHEIEQNVGNFLSNCSTGGFPIRAHLHIFTSRSPFPNGTKKRRECFSCCLLHHCLMRKPIERLSCAFICQET